MVTGIAGPDIFDASRDVGVHPYVVNSLTIRAPCRGTRRSDPYFHFQQTRRPTADVAEVKLE